MRGKVKLLVVMIVSLMIFGCGEEREHKPLSKIDVMSKSLVDTDKEYLYVASTGEVSRTTSLGRPYFQGQEEIVKLRFEESHLVAYIVDKEEKFRANKNNQKIVFKIPITHLEFREATDAFGEGINVEEENKFVDWADRKFFKAKAEEFDFTSVGTLPTEFSEVFGSDSCTSKQGQTELEFTVEESGIDIVIRRDFTSKIYCESSIDVLNDLTWSQETHYSLVPLEDMISKDYTAKEYTRDWERTFGFFDTTDKRLDSSNNTTQSTERYIMHRWNPNREMVTYHLDPRFEKPENAVLKSATLKGFERLNVALAESGAKLRVETVDGASDFKPGDIRKSSIVLVEDPVGAGLLGYGPSVTNPRTGEIVQARTVMYPGIMKKLIRRAYDELIEINDKKKNEISLESVNQLKKDFEVGFSTIVDNNKWKELKTDIPKELLQSEAEDEDVSEEEFASGNRRGNHLGKVVSLDKLDAKSFFVRTKESLTGLFHSFNELESDDRFNSKLHRKTDLLEAYSKNNMFPALPEAFTDLTDKALIAKILGIGKGEHWDALQESQREAIINIAMPYVWIPTLIHEVGHNLGLRHNFAGSEDKENFYSIEELAKKGVESELGSPYSSMMEYSKSEITGLRVPGKYDVAALRYGYADKIEMVDGSIVQAPEVKPLEGMKSFEFCTDEGVSLNPNCNRFDEGTNLIEITESIIDSYNKRYKTSYFRNQRSHFSRYDDLNFAAISNAQFRSLRLAFERLTDIMLTYDLSMDQVKEIEWLNEYNEASKIAAQFFMKVASEPDYSCVIYRNGEFNAVLSFLELQKMLNLFQAKVCSDLSVNLAEGFTVEGELGKSLLSRRFQDNPNIFLDQIDVRGVWFNKILAAKYLTRRTLNMFSFDDNTLSYLDHPEIGPEVAAFFKNMAMGKVIGKVDVSLNDGTEVEVDYQHSFASQSYEMPIPLRRYVSRYVGLPVRKMGLAPALLTTVINSVGPGKTTANTKDFIDGLSVESELPRNGTEDEYLTYKFLEDTYVFNRRNDLAFNIIRSIDLVNNVYSGFTREELIDIFNKMNKIPAPGEPEVEFTDGEMSVVNGGLEVLLDYLRGTIPGDDYYFEILNVMR